MNCKGNHGGKTVIVINNVCIEYKVIISSYISENIKANYHPPSDAFYIPNTNNSVLQRRM